MLNFVRIQLLQPIYHTCVLGTQLSAMHNGGIQLLYVVLQQLYR